MLILTLILLVGAHLAPFILKEADTWHAQGLWVQGWIAVLFTATFFVKPRKVSVRNVPLGLMHLWVALLTIIICAKAQFLQKYNISHFLPYFNFLCLLILYKIIVAYLTIEDIRKVLVFLKYTLVVHLAYCTLQIFDLSQFYEPLNPDHHAINNMMGGVVANPTHLSNLIGMCVPLFFIDRKKENIFFIAWLLVILMFTGETKGIPAISGFIVTAVCLFYFVPRKVPVLVGLVILAILGYYFLVGKVIRYEFFSFSGRLEIWGEYWKLFHQMPVTGPGLGTINTIYELTKLPLNRHLHMEYFHFMFELGIIGLGFILNMVYWFSKIKVLNKEEMVLKGILIGFLVSCLFLYPAHLWLPATIAMFCYAGLHVFKNERINYDERLKNVVT